MNPARVPVDSLEFAEVRIALCEKDIAFHQQAMRMAVKQLRSVANQGNPMWSAVDRADRQCRGILTAWRSAIIGYEQAYQEYSAKYDAHPEPRPPLLPKKQYG